MAHSGKPTEAATRATLIDGQLARAGWSKSRRNLIEEERLGVAEPHGAWPGDHFADDVLLGSDNKPLALVEAKRSSRDELAGSRLEIGKALHTQQEVVLHLQLRSSDLLESEPPFEVHTVLCQSLLDIARQASWQTELGLVQRVSK